MKTRLIYVKLEYFVLFRTMSQKIRLFTIPNVFTAFNMLSGVMAIVCCFSGRLEWAPWLIFLGAGFDFLDGFLARILKQPSELGKQLDSLADMITFGLAPGVMMMVYLVLCISWSQGYAVDFSSFTRLSMENWQGALFSSAAGSTCTKADWIPFLALLIPFFSLFRLAKFNIDTRQTTSFIGLPTPANAIFFTAFPLAMSEFYTSGANSWQESLSTNWLFIVVLIVTFSLLLVTELPLFSLKFKSFGWKGNEIRYVFLITCGLLIPLLGVWSIALIVFLYLIFSLFANRDVKNKKNEIQS